MSNTHEPRERFVPPSIRSRSWHELEFPVVRSHAVPAIPGSSLPHFGGETQPRTPLRQPTRRSHGVGHTCVAAALGFAAYERLAPSVQGASIPYPKAPSHGHPVTPRLHVLKMPSCPTGRVHRECTPMAPCPPRGVSSVPLTVSGRDCIHQATPGAMAIAPVADLTSWI